MKIKGRRSHGQLGFVILHTCDVPKKMAFYERGFGLLLRGVRVAGRPERQDGRSGVGVLRRRFREYPSRSSETTRAVEEVDLAPVPDAGRARRNLGAEAACPISAPRCRCPKRRSGLF
jgi:hypothetical protein